MADNTTVTGGRDDLVVDTSRCLRMRFNESSCRHCVDICPHGAVVLDDGLFIDTNQCRGCLLCTAVCPTGALEQSDNFSTCLAKLSKVPDPLLGCIRTKEYSNGIVACLGGLSEEHLLALYHSLAGRLTINLSLCSDCSNTPMIDKLQQRLDAIFAAGLSSGNCRVVIAKSVQDIRFHDEPVNRRSFFKSFSGALFKSADIITSTTRVQPETRTEYAGKRLPVRRELLNRIRSTASRELEARISKHFDSCVTFDENCAACHGCVAICPTGALKTGGSDNLPAFDHLFCTGCGLCREFCLDGAVRIF